MIMTNSYYLPKVQKNLEQTVGGLRYLLKEAPICKTHFSMVKSEEVLERMRLSGKSRDTVVLTGTEAHVAINFTCIDLLARRYKVS